MRLLLIVLLAAVPATADISGSIAGEIRQFASAATLPGQSDETQFSLVLEPEFRWQSEDRRHRVTFVPFARLDSIDDERSHVDLREGYWAFGDGGYELLAGVDKVFWGVTESRHLVDIVNQIDALEDVDEEDKLGQPMVRLTASKDWGTLTIFLLPGFRERSFVGIEGRPRLPLPVDEEATLYESRAGKDRLDLAVRYSHYFGDWDVGLSHFHGTGREPRLLPNQTATALIPRYDVIHQSGADVQYTREAWLWKLEAARRDGQGETFFAGVLGFEYTFYQALGAGDVGLLVEYLRDERDAAAPPTIFDDDLFVGARLALNDTQNTAILAGAIVDTHDRSTSALVEGSRRLGRSWTVELEARLFLDVAPDNTLAPFAREDFVNLRVARNF